MPPKRKITRQEIIAAALELVKREGIDALTARSLSTALGTSVMPIFSQLENMEKVREEVVAAAKGVYAEYVNAGLAQPHAFKGVGMQYIAFATEQPNLFRLLFMSQSSACSVDGLLPAIDDNYPQILQSVCDAYALDGAQAQRLYHHIWIYTHGIATVCATGLYHYTTEQISGMLTEVFTALLIKTKRGDQ